MQYLISALHDDEALKGFITNRNQIKAINIKFLESQLEAIPQCLLQFCILWKRTRKTFGYFQIITLILSMISVSKGSLDYIRIKSKGNRERPSFVELPKILPFLLHFFMVFSRKGNVLKDLRQYKLKLNYFIFFEHFPQLQFGHDNSACTILESTVDPTLLFLFHPGSLLH